MTDKMIALLKGHLKTKHKIDGIYQYQEDIARIIFDALIQNLQLTKNADEEQIKRLKRIESGFEISRQAGKTTIIVACIEFAMLYFTELFNKPLQIGIFAPQREQAKTDFDKLKTMLRIDSDFTVISHSEQELEAAKEESNAKTIVLPNGSSCYIFPVTTTSKPESKTLDLIIFEESQDLDDKIITQQIIPMTAATNGPLIFIGTAGTQICRFYRMGQEGLTKKIYFDEIIKQRQQLYNQTGNSNHLIYENTIKQDIEKYGLDSDEIQRPYFGKWLIGTGQFVTDEQLGALVDPSRQRRTYQEKKHKCYVGIDTAKNPDSTVVTVIRDNEQLGKRELINWLELRGENYKDQFDIILDFLSNYDVRALAIDSTGQGDFMPDLFERESKFIDENHGLYRVKFSALNKDIMYKNLKVTIKELLTTIPPVDTKEAGRFRMQMLDLQQEYKGQLLSVKHPDDANAHDDYCDSWALAEYAFAKEKERNIASIYVIENEQNVRKNTSDFYGDQWGDD